MSIREIIVVNDGRSIAEGTFESTYVFPPSGGLGD
jgi:hypothetical protein